MSKSHRLEKKGKGRPKKVSPQQYNYLSRLGGIPMKCQNGQIDYVWKPNCSNKNIKADEIMRENAVLLSGDGSFVRRHLYEMRFNISSEAEPDDERRKREYKEWIEKFI